MPGPTKVKFKLEDLKARALESLDARIENAGRNFEQLTDQTVYEEDCIEWRRKAEEQIVNLAHRISIGESMSNVDLSRAALLPNRPQRDEHAIVRARKALEALEAERTKVVAKSESLVADEDGNISLTKSQLSDFFSL